MGVVLLVGGVLPYSLLLRRNVAAMTIKYITENTGLDCPPIRIEANGKTYEAWDITLKGTSKVEWIENQLVMSTIGSIIIWPTHEEEQGIYIA